jgi:hypothetical protein
MSTKITTRNNITRSASQRDAPIRSMIGCSGRRFRYQMKFPRSPTSPIISARQQQQQYTTEISAISVTGDCEIEEQEYLTTQPFVSDYQLRKQLKQKRNAAASAFVLASSAENDLSSPTSTSSSSSLQLQSPLCFSSSSPPSKTTTTKEDMEHVYDTFENMLDPLPLQSEMLDYEKQEMTASLPINVFGKGDVAQHRMPAMRPSDLDVQHGGSMRPSDSDVRHGGSMRPSDWNLDVQINNTINNNKYYADCFQTVSNASDDEEEEQEAVSTTIENDCDGYDSGASSSSSFTNIRKRRAFASLKLVFGVVVFV